MQRLYAHVNVTTRYYKTFSPSSRNNCSTILLMQNEIPWKNAFTVIELILSRFANLLVVQLHDVTRRCCWLSQMHISLPTRMRNCTLINYTFNFFFLVLCNFFYKAWHLDQSNESKITKYVNGCCKIQIGCVAFAWICIYLVVLTLFALFCNNNLCKTFY